MQHRDAIERVAEECAQDLAADGVVYAEIRFGPSLHMIHGLTREAAIEAVLDGLDKAQREPGIVLYAVAAALRHEAEVFEVAETPWGTGVVLDDARRRGMAARLAATLRDLDSEVSALLS